MLTEATKKIIDEVIREVGEELRNNFGRIESYSRKEGEASDLVTEFDIAAEKRISERLHNAEPSITFVGEETGGDRKAERFWLLDPIDGTTHFIRGVPFCTTMLALIEEGVVNYSVIYNFVLDEMYIAERGKGATLNGNKISVSNHPISGSYMGYETNTTKGENLQLQEKVRQQKVAIVHTINTGYEFGLVASGKLDGRIQIDPFGSDYDFAPGSLLVEEAGGVVANIGSNTYDYKNLSFLATNPIIFSELTQGPKAIFPIIEV